MRGFADQVDVRACKALLLVIAVYLIAGLLAWVALPKQKSLPPQPRVWPAILVAFAGAVAAYLLLPHHLNELSLTTFFPRFAVLVALMAIALVPAGLARACGVLRLFVPLPALVMCALYGHQLIVHYRLYAKETRTSLRCCTRHRRGARQWAWCSTAARASCGWSRLFWPALSLRGHPIRTWQHDAFTLLRDA